MKARAKTSVTAAVAGAALLTGCGSSVVGGSAADAPTPTVQSLLSPPTGPDKPVGTVLVPPRSTRPFVPGDFAPEVAWSRDQLIVTAFGSSTCRPTATAATAGDPHTIVVTFASANRSEGLLCTDDYGPTRSRIPAPADGIDLGGDVYAVFVLDGARRQLIPVNLFHPTFS